MTNQELQELSKRVAEKFKVDALYEELTPMTQENPCGDSISIWLHQDLERVMRLAIEHCISLNFDSDMVTSDQFGHEYYPEYYQDHDTRERAVIVAVMKALCEVEV